MSGGDADGTAKPLLVTEGGTAAGVSDRTRTGNLWGHNPVL